MQTATYQPSGRVPALTGPAFLCSCCLAAQGALFYALLTLGDWWYWSPVVAWAFAFCLALIVRAACLLAKVRNPGLMRQFGLIVGLFAWLMQWIFWIVFASYDSVRNMPGQSMVVPIADLFAGPDAFHRGLVGALTATEWSVTWDDLFVRVAAWLGELCLFLIMPSRAGFKQAGKPFCEASAQWAARTVLPQEFAGDTLLKAREYLARSPEALLAALSPLDSPRNCHAKVTLHVGKLKTFISVEVIECWSEGRRREQRHHTIVEHLGVPLRAVDHFMRRLSQASPGEPKLAGKRSKRPGSGKSGKRPGQSAKGGKPVRTG